MDREQSERVALADAMMKRAFFIYDRDAVGNEEDPPENMVVYFYPPEFPIHQQYLLIGACHSIINFTKNFTRSLPKVIAMEREKMAFKEVDSYTLVLTGNINQPDTALYLDLEMIHGAFQFLYGSFDIVLKNVGNDKMKFLEVMKKLGKDITPFIRQYENEAHPSFDKIPFANLPPGNNRYFLMASEILTSLKSEPDNLGGCILLSGSVLCTHLEKNTTSYILTLLDPMIQEQGQSYQNQKQSRRQSSLGSGDTSVPIFLSTEELEKLREGRRPGIEMKDDFLQMHPEFSLNKIESNGEFVALYALFLSKISIAIVMNLPAVYDERHLRKTRLLLESRLLKLESKLQKIWRFVGECNPSPINYLVYDKSTKHLQGSLLEMSSEVDVKFHIATRIQHELFCSKPNVTYLMLRDHIGVVLGKRTFDIETYFHYRSFPMLSNFVKFPVLNRDISKLEEAARDSLQDLSISLL